MYSSNNRICAKQCSRFVGILHINVEVQMMQQQDIHRISPQKIGIPYTVNRTWKFFTRHVKNMLHEKAGG